jgi:energy-coupling factor transport system ATP-binding protein
LIKLEDVSYIYPGEGGASALNNVSLQIDQGEFVAVIGHNGSGKSTLAKHLNALLTPSSGRVLVQGLDTRDNKLVWQIRQIVGMVFQNPDNQLVATVVEEDVAFGPENLALPPQEIRLRVEEALQAVGMTEFKLRPPHLLSGGQKQRVAIAGILAMRPACLVMDEATAMLDPAGRKEVLQTITRLNREYGLTVIHITHFMDEAAAADRVMVMEKGQIVLEGSPRQVFAQVDTLRHLGLGIPQMADLAAGLAHAGLPINRDILTIEEMVAALSRLASKPDIAAASKDGVAATLNFTPSTFSLTTNETGNIRKNSAAAAPSNEYKTKCRTPKKSQAIRLEEISYSYKKGTPFQTDALNDISLEIEQGEFIAVIGATGSGKSTLVQHFNGLLRPTSGRVFLHGVDTMAKGVSLQELRKKVGLLFQYPEHQLFEETVWRDISFGPRNLGIADPTLAKRVRRSMELVGLDPEVLGNRSPFSLSGGQMRRVALAGVLAMEPEVLILDEPTAGLDPRGREDVLSLISSLHRKLGITVVFVSHSMEDVARLANRILVIHQGSLAMDGTPQQIFGHSEKLQEFGLDVPLVTIFMRELKLQGIQVSTEVFTVEQAKASILQAVRGKTND